MGVAKAVSLECCIVKFLPLTAGQLYVCDAFYRKPNVVINRRETHMQQAIRLLNIYILLHQLFGGNDLLQPEASFRL